MIQIDFQKLFKLKFKIIKLNYLLSDCDFLFKKEKKDNINTIDDITIKIKISVKDKRIEKKIPEISPLKVNIFGAPNKIFLI